MDGWMDGWFHPPSWLRNYQIIRAVKTLRGGPVQIFQYTGRETEAWRMDGPMVRPSQAGTGLSVPWA